MQKFLLLVVFCLPILVQAQFYYPPNSGSTWDSMAPDSLGWCQERIDSLYQFLDDRDTRSFIVLKDGKVVLEEYFAGTNPNSNWYWASCGKSLVAYLIGIAQDEGAVDIMDPVSDYLGQGWTSCTPMQEDSITLFHLLSMTSGLDDGFGMNNCSADSCLEYLAPTDSRWAYHTGAYRALQDVIDSAYVNLNFSQFTNQKLGNRIGMGGFWLSKVRWGNARDMARFGLLALGGGVWDGDTILGDVNYLNDMVQPSNSFNQAYGYLWWLNGSSTYMLPGLQTVVPGPLVPSAPQDLIAALGKNDQKIYLVPSQGLVVVRQGEDASNAPLALSAFDEELWQYINLLNCPLAQEEENWPVVKVYPNPASEWISVDIDGLSGELEWWYAMNGRMVRSVEVPSDGGRFNVSDLARGTYLLRFRRGMESRVTKVVLL